MNRKHLISKVEEIPPSWTIGNASVPFLETEDDWRDITESYDGDIDDMTEKQLKPLQLENCQSSNSSETFSSFHSDFSEPPPINALQSRQCGDAGLYNTPMNSSSNIKSEAMDQDSSLSDEDAVLKALFKCPSQMGSDFVIMNHIENSTITNERLKTVLEELKQQNLVDSAGLVWVIKPKGMDYLKEKFGIISDGNISRSEQGGKAAIMRRGTGPPPTPRALLESEQQAAGGMTSSTLIGHQSQDAFKPQVPQTLSSSSMKSQGFGSPVPMNSLESFRFQSNQSIGAPAPLMSVDTSTSKFSQLQQPLSNPSRLTLTNPGRSPLLNTLSIINQYQQRQAAPPTQPTRVRPSLLTIRGPTPINEQPDTVMGQCSSSSAPSTSPSYPFQGSSATTAAQNNPFPAFSGTSNSQSYPRLQQPQSLSSGSHLTVGESLVQQFSKPPPSLPQQKEVSSSKPPPSPAELLERERCAKEGINMAEAAVGINVLMKNLQPATASQSTLKNGEFSITEKYEMSTCK